MSRFTVDPHLFAELGALLVGRDSTALNELVKNAYDADASIVVVHGQGLDTAQGSIRVVDDGTGMTTADFEVGFLRIASRSRREGDRRSAVYGRRYTGRKGIGRLATHKLASQVTVNSTPDPQVYGAGQHSLQATIDWDVIEGLESLEDSARGVALDAISPASKQHGTTIELRGLRKRWTETMLATFVGEVQSFGVPEFLVGHIPASIAAAPLLFECPTVRDSSGKDPGFEVHLTGDFDTGDNYWLDLAMRSQWIIEILAKPGEPFVEYAIGPTLPEVGRTPLARQGYWKYPHPDPESGPFFSARIFVRSHTRVPRTLQAFARTSAGIRLFMEGFRVLPYGERGDDWLRLDADYTRRREPFELGGFSGPSLEDPVDGETLLRLANSNYYGGVFLTDSGAPMLNMLINREGFIPDQGFDILKSLVRRGVDLSVRMRASVQSETAARSLPRLDPGVPKQRAVDDNFAIATAALDTMKRRSDEVPVIKEQLGQSIDRASGALKVIKREFSDARSEQRHLRIAASVGTQLSSFLHEINALLGQARSVNELSERLAAVEGLPAAARRTVNEVRDSIRTFVSQIERQASFLTDVVGANARRRRQRLKIDEQVEIASRLLASRIENRKQTISVTVGTEVRTPPMFSSEFLSIMINVLGNAIKAAGEGGIIYVDGMSQENSLVLQVSNTGVAVDLSESERWFRPFESTTTEIDEVLGQGMGLGLPIVRRLLEEYGGSADFIQPNEPFATTLEIRIPERSR